jgi:hypothetical protein
MQYGLPAIGVLQWGHLGRLFPWAAVGVVSSFFALGLSAVAGLVLIF